MNRFDASILIWLNGMMGRWPDLERLLVFFLDSNLFKCAPVMALFYWAWFRREGQPRARETLLCALGGSMASVVVARLLAAVTPMRLRPIHEAVLGLRLATGLDPRALIHWSAFPSDHAALFTALATGIFLVSRRAGLLAFAWTAVMVCFVRVLLGVHHPTDVLAGGVIGFAAAWVACRPALRQRVSAPLLELEGRRPALFYALFFVLTFEFCELFVNVRSLYAHLRVFV